MRGHSRIRPNKRIFRDGWATNSQLRRAREFNINPSRTMDFICYMWSEGGDIFGGDSRNYYAVTGRTRYWRNQTSKVHPHIPLLFNPNK